MKTNPPNQRLGFLNQERSAYFLLAMATFLGAVVTAATSGCDNASESNAPAVSAPAAETPAPTTPASGS